MADLSISPEEIRGALDSFMESYRPADVATEEVGHVIETADGIAHVEGLPGTMANELLRFEDGTLGLAMNLDQREIGAVVLGDFGGIEEGQVVHRTGEVLSVPVGDGYLGRTVDPLGRPIDGLGEITDLDGRRALELQAPGVMARKSVHEPLATGLKAIDSMIPILDSTRYSYARVVQTGILTGHYQSSPYAYEDSSALATQEARISQLEERYRHPKAEDAQKLPSLSLRDSLQAIDMALDKAARIQDEARIYSASDDGAFYSYRTFHQEWHRKFTYPVSCIIFCLIGASLGAIVRRGGIGMPIIISIFFFVVYFIIDSFGTNMLRNETIPIWLGMWLSNIMLFPVGIFLAYKANQDSSALNVEAYVIFFRKLFGFRGVRKVEYQELVIEETDYVAGAHSVALAQEHTEALLKSPLLSQPIWRIWRYGRYQEDLLRLSKELDELTESLRHTSARMLTSKLGDLPLLPTRISPLLPHEERRGLIFALILPLSLPLTLFFGRVRSHLKSDLKTTQSVLGQIAQEIEVARQGTQAKTNTTEYELSTTPTIPSDIPEEVAIQ